MLYKERRQHYISAWQYKGEEPIPKSLHIVPYMGPQANAICQQCGRPLKEHGILNNGLLCPKSYILREGSIITAVMTKEQFESVYEPLGEIVEIK